MAGFDDDGTATGLPLVFGEGCLTPANGFNPQADALIDAGPATDVLRATPMVAIRKKGGGKIAT